MPRSVFYKSVSSTAWTRSDRLPPYDLALPAGEYEFDDGNQIFKLSVGASTSSSTPAPAPSSDLAPSPTLTPPPTPSATFSLSAPEAFEGSPITATVTVVRNGETGAIPLTWRVEANAMASVADFPNALPFGDLTIADGSSTTSWQIPTLDDLIDEADREYAVLRVLRNGQHAVATNLAILDNDPASIPAPTPPSPGANGIQIEDGSGVLLTEANERLTLENA